MKAPLRFPEKEEVLPAPGEGFVNVRGPPIWLPVTKRVFVGSKKPLSGVEKSPQRNQEGAPVGDHDESQPKLTI